MTPMKEHCVPKATTGGRGMEVHTHYGYMLMRLPPPPYEIEVLKHWRLIE